MIASSADASKNALNTGSLTFSDLQNKAEYHSFSASVSGGGGGFNGSMSVPQSKDSSSTTKSGIAAGAIDVRQQPGRDLSGLDRNPDMDAGGLKTIFDQKKVAERQEMGQVAGYVGMRAAGDLAGQMGWAEGSKERTVLHGAVGAAIASLGGGDAMAGGLGAAANQAAVPAIANYLMDQGYKADSPEFATMMQVAAISIGAVAGEGSGASAALDGTKYNYLSHRQIDELKDALANCKDQACRDSVTAEAKKASASNDLALAMTCQSGDATACYKGMGALESYYGNTSVPDSLKKDQRLDAALEQSGYFGDIGLWGGLRSSAYAYLPQDDERGLFVAGAVIGAVHGTIPFLGNDEQSNPNNPFFSKQVGSAPVDYTTNMPSGMAQGAYAGESGGNLAWLALTEGAVFGDILASRGATVEQAVASDGFSTATSSTRARVEANIAESAQARSASNFEIHVLNEQAPSLDVSTPYGGAVVWSNARGGNLLLADSFITQNPGYMRLENTPGGQYFDSLKLFDRYPYEQAIQPWERLSASYAISASGEVKAFTSGASPGSVFRRIELPILLRNPGVTDIKYMPPSAGAK